MTKVSDLEGKVFGSLKVVKRLDNNKNGQSRWLFTCSCGVEFEGSVEVTKGKYLKCKSCSNISRGYDSRKYNDLENYKPVYQTWRGMKERCNNPNSSHYKYYGALGIKVCESWSDKENGFRNFYNDMGQRPDGMTLDRIDVYSDYCKENCRWSDLTTQAYTTKREHLNKTGRIGVSERGGNKWVAFISYKRVRHYLGIFSNFEDACKAREEAELKYYGVTK